jgi:hypothetical protein
MTLTTCSGCGITADVEDFSYCPTCNVYICPQCDCPHPVTFNSTAEKREYVEFMAEEQREMDATLERIAELSSGDAA